MGVTFSFDFFCWVLVAALEDVALNQHLVDGERRRTCYVHALVKVFTKLVEDFRVLAHDF